MGGFKYASVCNVAILCDYNPTTKNQINSNAHHNIGQDIFKCSGLVVHRTFAAVPLLSIHSSIYCHAPHGTTFLSLTLFFITHDCLRPRLGKGKMPPPGGLEVLPVLLVPAGAAANCNVNQRAPDRVNINITISPIFYICIEPRNTYLG